MYESCKITIEFKSYKGKTLIQQLELKTFMSRTIIVNDLNNSDGLFSVTTGIYRDIAEVLLKLEVAKQRARGGFYKGPRLKEFVELLGMEDWLDRSAE